MRNKQRPTTTIVSARRLNGTSQQHDSYRGNGGFGLGGQVAGSAGVINDPFELDFHFVGAEQLAVLGVDGHDVVAATVHDDQMTRILIMAKLVHLLLNSRNRA